MAGSNSYSPETTDFPEKFIKPMVLYNGESPAGKALFDKSEIRVYITDKQCPPAEVLTGFKQITLLEGMETLEDFPIAQKTLIESGFRYWRKTVTFTDNPEEADVYVTAYHDLYPSNPGRALFPPNDNPSTKIETSSTKPMLFINVKGELFLSDNEAEKRNSMAHEVGHALGILHPDINAYQNTIMQPRKREAHADDICVNSIDLRVMEVINPGFRNLSCPLPPAPKSAKAR